MGSTLAPGRPDRKATLREYPRNSAYAAARVVAAALISNGCLKAVESAALDALDAHAKLGLASADWSAVIGALRQDLEGTARREGLAVCPYVLERMLEEVTDERLQRLVAALSVVVIHADLQVERGEQMVLQALQQRWGVITTLAESFRILRDHSTPRIGTSAPLGSNAMSAALRCSST